MDVVDVDVWGQDYELSWLSELPTGISPAAIPSSLEDPAGKDVDGLALPAGLTPGIWIGLSEEEKVFEICGDDKEYWGADQFDVFRFGYANYHCLEVSEMESLDELLTISAPPLMSLRDM